MWLEMIVDNTHGKPGFNRIGMVILRAPHERTINVKAFFVRLLGISKTSICTHEDSSKKTQESNSIFLEIQKDLARGLKVLEHQFRSEFQFRFPFPDDRTTRTFFPRTANPYQDFELPQPQALPPAGSFGSGNTIVYKMEVNLIEEDSVRHIKAEQDFTFSMTRTVPASDPMTTTIVHKRPIYRRAGSHDPQHLTLGLRCTSEVVQGELLSLWIRRADENELSSANVLLKSSVVQLIEKTSIQGHGVLRDSCIEKYVIASRIYESGLPAITTQATNLGALLHDPSISSSHPPSFSSPNIQRTYGISISLTVEVEGYKTYKVSFNLDSILLLPAERFDTAWQTEVEEEELNDPFDILPPAYEYA